jgi:hypothetical protein
MPTLYRHILIVLCLLLAACGSEPPPPALIPPAVVEEEAPPPAVEPSKDLDIEAMVVDPSTAPAENVVQLEAPSIEKLEYDELDGLEGEFVVIKTSRGTTRSGILRSHLTNSIRLGSFERGREIDISLPRHEVVGIEVHWNRAKETAADSVKP